MIGFLSGVGVNIIAGQVPDLTGAPADGSVAVQKAWNVVIHPAGIDGASVLVGVAAFVIIILLGRTPIAAFGAVFALAVPTIVAVLAGADIAQVKDQGDIPRGIPLPAWPPCPPSRGRCSRAPSPWRRSCSCRWASIFSGLWMLVILAVFSGIVGEVAMPTR